MLVLPRLVQKFNQYSYCLLDLLKIPDSQSPRGFRLINELPDRRTVYVTTTGVLNALWQAWNNLCKSYWKIFIYGGQLSHVSTILPFTYARRGLVASDDEHLLYSFLYPTRPGYYQRQYHNQRIEQYREPSWGRRDLLSQIATYYQNIYPQIASLLGALSLAGNAIDHLQYVRNASVHINNASLEKLQQLAPFYSVRTMRYPSDYAFAVNIRTGKLAVEYWIDELCTMCTLLYI